MIKVYFSKIEAAENHSECFTRSILSDYHDMDSDSLVVCKNEFGKPYLRDYPNIHYNISHIKGVIVCAVSDKPVGIDIERVKKINKRIVERYFTQNEQSYIFASKENQDERFVEIWTRKEAYVKRIGKGMAIPFETFDVLKKEEIMTLWFGIYCIAVCSTNCRQPISVIDTHSTLVVALMPKRLYG